MTTRRTALMGALLSSREILAKASQPKTPVSFAVPARACDCHTHIFGDFPLFEGRGYTPEFALPQEMSALHKALRMQRVVIVTPSIYGTGNASTLCSNRVSAVRLSTLVRSKESRVRIDLIL